MRMLIRGFLMLLTTAVLGALVGVVPASAHSRLLSSSPKDGASLPSSPTEIVLTFNEDINPEFVTVRVTDAEGTESVAGKATVSGPRVTLPVSTALLAGGYSVAYRVVSADSHPISGKTSFTVAASATPSTTPSTSPSGDPSASASGSTGSASPSTTPAPPTPSPSSTSAAAGDESGSSFLIPGLLIGGVLVVGAGAFLGLRRRDTGDSGPGRHEQ